MKLRDLNPACDMPVGGASVYDEFKGLLLNAIKIVSTDTGEQMPAPEQRFVKNALIENDAVGYDGQRKQWSYVVGEGLTIYGNPVTLRFIVFSTKRTKTSYTRKASYEPTEEGAYIITASEGDYSIGQVMRECATLIGKCRDLKFQNLLATATPYIVVCRDEDLRLSVEHAIQQKEEGVPVLVVSNELGEALKGLDLNVPIVFDKIDEFEQKVYDRMLNKIGTMSANINKRERVQVGEVNATVGQCEDYIYQLIDWFNRQMVSYGLPWEMQINNSLEELYTDDETAEADMQANNEVNENV